jgi:hypothetical protein
MTRNKSRVARRSRARRGTRKQSGGFSFPSFPSFPSLSSLNPLNWFKKSEPATGVVDAPRDAPTTTVAAVPAALPVHDNLPDQSGGRKKSRKTRHRRRSHHRK